MVLHEARIGNSVIGCRGANTAARLLQYCCKDKAVVDECRGGNKLDGFVHVYDFLLGVEGDVELAAGLFHVPSAVIEPCRSSVRRYLVTEGVSRTHISMKDIHLSFEGQPSSVEPLPLYCV